MFRDVEIVGGDARPVGRPVVGPDRLDLVAGVGDDRGLHQLPPEREHPGDDRDPEDDDQEGHLVGEVRRRLPARNGHTHQDQHEEDQPDVAGPRVTGHLERARRDDPAVAQPAQLQLAQEDRGPGEQHADRRRLQGDLEGVRHQEVQQRAEHEDHRGHHDAGPRHALGAHLQRELRRLLAHAQAAQHPAGRVQPRVQAGHGGDDEHDLDRSGHPGEAQPLEDGHERAGARLVLAGGQHRDQQQDRTAVEDGDPEDDRVDRLRHLGLGVLHLAGGHADHLDGGVGEHDPGHRQQRSVPVEVPAGGPEAARVAPQVVEPGLVPADAEAADHDHEPDRQEDHDRGDLGDRGPELELPERPRRQQVDHQHHGQRDQHRQPGRQVREPVLHVQPDRRQLGDAGERPVQPVHPAGDEGPLLAVELAHVGDEGTRGGAVQHQLAERAHQEVGDHADEDVGEQQRRSVVVQPGGRAQEQPGPDRPADGDHLDVPAPQALFVAGLLGVQRIVRRFGLRHNTFLTLPGRSRIVVE